MRRYSIGTPWHALAASLSVLAGGQVAAATDIEGAVSRGSQLDQFIERDLLRRSLDRQPDEAGEIDGEAGLFVLTKNDIFFLGGGASAGWESNPAQTDDNPGSSTFLGLGLSGGVRTRIAERYDASLTASLGVKEYAKDEAPSNRNLNLTGTFGAPLKGGPGYLEGSLFTGVNYDDHFDNGVWFHGGSLTLSAILPVGGRAFVRPGIGLVGQWSDDEDYNNYAATASVDGRYRVDANTTLFGLVSATHRVYDDFFEDVTAVEREDETYRASAGLFYDLGAGMTIGGFVGYAKRNSTFFVPEYEGIEVQLLFSRTGWF